MIECYESTTFNNQTCVWDVTGEQPERPVTECYETATFNVQTCVWDITDGQEPEPEVNCYETATFNNITCTWDVTGEQPEEPVIECYELATFNGQTCVWDITGEQPEQPVLECYEIATFNDQTCVWDIRGEQPEQPVIECYESATFNVQTCVWDVTGEQPEQPVIECYELATFNVQTCVWDVTGEQPEQPVIECYETTTFNTQTCLWDVTGTEPMISAEEPLCDEDYGTYTVVVNVNIGDVTSSLGDPQNNFNGTWTINNIPVDFDVTITTSLDDNCLNSVVVESPDCICIELDLKYTDVTCFGLDDGSITVEFVTEGATVTVNGELYDADMLYVPGTYTVVAYFEGNDDEDCIVTQDITIIEPDLVEIQVSSTDVTTCYGDVTGTITIESISEGASYTIKLNGVGPDLSGQDYFAAGTYVVEASLIDNSLSRKANVNKKDISRVQDPCIDAKLVVIAQPKRLVCRIGKSFSGDKIRCNDRTNNTLTVNHIGGVGPYTYSWTMDKSAYYGIWQIESGAEEQTMTYIPGMQNATFTIEITDANGCTTTCEITLKSTCTKIDYFNYFSRQADFDFEMFPNPTKGKLTIMPNMLSGDSATVELYDLVGTRIINQTFSKIRDKKIDINLSDLSSQVYYLKVITKDGTKIKKVVLDK